MLFRSGVHPIERAIVDHDAARRGRLWRVDRGRVAADRENRHVPTRPVEIVDILAFDGAAAVADFDVGALAARRGDGGQFIDGEFALGENGEHFAPDIARGSGDNDTITHYL